MRSHVPRPAERVPRLVAWTVAVAAVIALAALASVTPFTPPWHGRFAVPTGSAFLEGWLGRPFHLTTLLVAGLGAALTLHLQRGQEDRFEPLAVLAAAIGVAGHSAAIATLHRVLRFDEHLPIALLRFAEALLAGAVLCGLAALPRLLVLRARRGRGIAIGAAGVCAFALFVLEGVWLRQPAASPQASGMELVGLEFAHPYYPDRHERRPVATVRADGSLELGGEALAADENEAWRSALRATAAGMRQHDGVPDEALGILADRRAPARAVATLAGLAAEERIWKQQLVVERRSGAEALGGEGLLTLYWALDRTGASREQIATAPAERVLRVSPAASGAASYTLGDESYADPRELRPRWAALAEDEPLYVVVQGDVSWGDVLAALDAKEISGASLFLGALVVED